MYGSHSNTCYTALVKHDDCNSCGFGKLMMVVAWLNRGYDERESYTFS